MKSADNLRFYGELDSAVYIGAKGATLPTGLADPGVTFEDAGWLHEDGVPFERDTDTQDTPAFQGGAIVKRKTKVNGEQVKFTCLEENLVSIGLAYPDATITTASGVTKIVPSGRGSKEVSAVVDLVDESSVTKRYCVSRGEAALTAEIPHKNDEPTTYEITLTVYEYFILTDNPALAGA